VLDTHRNKWLKQELRISKDMVKHMKKAMNNIVNNKESQTTLEETIFNHKETREQGQIYKGWRAYKSKLKADSGYTCHACQKLGSHWKRLAYSCDLYSSRTWPDIQCVLEVSSRKPPSQKIWCSCYAQLEHFQKTQSRATSYRWCLCQIMYYPTYVSGYRPSGMGTITFRWNESVASNDE